MKLKQILSAIPLTSYVLLLILVVIYTYIANTTCDIVTDTLSHTIRQDIVYRTSESADFLRIEIEAMKKNIEGLASRDDIRSMDWTRQKPILLSEKKRLRLENIQVISLDGISRFTDGAIHDVSKYEYFKKAKNGLTVLEDIPVEYKKGSQFIICAAPILNEDSQIAGVLSTYINSVDLFKILDLKRTGTSGFSFIMNRQGVVIAHPKYQTVEFNNGTDNANLHTMLACIKRGEFGSGFYQDRGIKNFVVFSPIYHTKWSIVTMVPSSEVFSEVYTLKARLVHFFLFTLILILLIGTLFTYNNRQKHKIATLQESADKSEKLLLESKELDQLKTDFFANISHEFRTPLSVIHGTLQLLIPYVNNRPELDRDYISKRLNIIRQNCLRSIRLSNNMIDATKIDAGFYELHLTNCDIVKLVEEITLSVADFIKSKGISVQFNSDIKEKIMACDPDKIERILLNLLANAVKFTNNDGSIFVSIVNKETSVIVSVKDTGIGIPPEKTSLIFERFRQVDQSTSRCSEGSGIGLSLVQSFVKMHSGTVSILSVPGEGSDFIIELPASIAPENQNESREYIPDRMQYFEKINIEFSDIYL